MVSNTVTKDPLPDPREAMEARDRALAFKYVEADEPKNGVSALAREIGVARKVLERAIRRQIDWARDEWSRLNPPA